MSENQDDKIVVEHLVKTYNIYNTPMDRFKEAVFIPYRERHVQFNAISDVSLRVKQGEIVGIMGSNGAGKSTLLKLITGVLTPTSGTVRVKGKISSLLELGAGFNMEYTGHDNIYFYCTLMGMDKKKIDNCYQQIVDFAEIGDYIYQPVKTYSSGMFARLAFACAINVEPDILIVDEILSVGDIRFQARCFNKFKEFQKNGVTILYVGHDVSLMKTFCDRGIWLNKGRIMMEGDPAEVASQYVEFMYLEKDQKFTEYQRMTTEQEFLETPAQPAEKTWVPAEKPVDDHFPEALAHWGTHIGMVEKAFVLVNGEACPDCFSPEDEVEFGFIFTPRDINFDVLSVAISIKNKEGTDLIVKTSFDEEISVNGENGKTYRVSFKLKTYLAVGEYYLVIALENRTEVTPMYYEYIDGALFFKVYTNKAIYGKVDLPAKIDVVEVSNE